jgi:hypothetical protein
MLKVDSDDPADPDGVAVGKLFDEIVGVVGTASEPARERALVSSRS